MRRRKKIGRVTGTLAAVIWLAGAAVFPFVGETAQPGKSQPSDSAIVGNSPVGSRGSNIQIHVAQPETGKANRPASEARPAETAADRVWNKVNRESAAGNVQKSIPQKAPVAVEQKQRQITRPGTAAAAAPASLTGYTEAEIREQMIRKYTPPKPAFRRVSGPAAGTEYRPGTADVKIPTIFFPPDEMKDVSEEFQENPDGSLGVRSPGDPVTGSGGYSAEALKQMREAQGSPAVHSRVPVQSSKGRGRTKSKIITVQVPVPAPSPFRALAGGDFRWFTNNKGHYLVALPLSMPYDPLQNLPAYGPMLIRNASQSEFMAVTADDPSDTYYYKNQDTFPAYGKAVPVFMETRKNIQGDDVAIKYIRYYLGGQHCLIVDSAGKRGGRTFRVAVAFPESKQYEYLPKALFAIENLKGI